MIALLILASGIAIAVIPFAVSDTIDAAIIAGIFSVVNTILNLRIIGLAKRNYNSLDEVKGTARTANDDLKEALKHDNGDS